jgi:hypothetical protein
MPGPAPSAAQAGQELFAALERRVLALEVWVRLQNDTGWVPLTLQGTWKAQAGTAVPAYRVKNGVAYLRGVVTSGASGEVVAILPESAWPAGLVQTGVSPVSAVAVSAAGSVTCGFTGSITNVGLSMSYPLG